MVGGCLLLLSGPSALAQSTTTTVADGDFTNGATWDNGVPSDTVGTDNAIIDNALFLSSGGSTFRALTIGNSAAGTLTVNGGALITDTSGSNTPDVFGFNGNTGTLIINSGGNAILGGNITAVGTGNGSTGIITVEDGTLQINAPRLGLSTGNGIMNVTNSAANVTITNALHVGGSANGSGSYGQTAGTVLIDSGDLDIGIGGGSGIFFLSGGSFTAESGVDMAASGSIATFIQEGGIFESFGGNFETSLGGDGVAILRGGTFIQSSNNIIVAQANGALASFVVQGGVATTSGNIRVANQGTTTGFYTQTGGTVFTGGDFDTGDNGTNNSGNLAVIDISSGVLNVGDSTGEDFNIGGILNNAMGSANITGGTINVADKFQLASSSGLNAIVTMNVGGSAEINVGVNSIEGDLNLASEDTGTGDVTFNFGETGNPTMSVQRTIFMGEGRSVFTIAGGSIGVGSNIEQTNGNGISTLNLNGGILSVDGSITNRSGSDTINYNGTQLTVGGALNGDSLIVGGTADTNATQISGVAAAANQIASDTVNVDTLTLGGSGNAGTYNVNNGILNIAQGINEGAGATGSQLNVGIGGVGTLNIAPLSQSNPTNTMGEIDAFLLGDNGTLAIDLAPGGLRAIEASVATLTNLSTIALNTSNLANSDVGETAIRTAGASEWTTTDTNWIDRNPGIAEVIGTGDTFEVINGGSGVNDLGTNLTGGGGDFAFNVVGGTSGILSYNGAGINGGPITAQIDDGATVTRNTDLRIAAEAAGENPNGNPDAAALVMNGGLLTVNGNVRTGGFFDPGNITVNGGALLGSGDLTLGTFNGGQDGILRVNGGVVSFNGDVREFGNANNGLIAIDGGTLLSDNIRAQRVRIGDVAGTTGFHAVTTGQEFRAQTGGGGDSFRVGNAGTGVLSMNGGNAGNSSGNGTTVVFGTAATGIGTGLINGGIIQSFSNFDVGQSGRGVVIVNGGTLTTFGGGEDTNNNLRLAAATGGFGSLNLVSGEVRVNDDFDLAVGADGDAFFFMSGGILTANSGIDVAQNGTGTANFIQTGGFAVNRGGNLEVGLNGTGVVVVSGGTFRQETNNIIVSQNNNSVGTFQIDEGAFVQTLAGGDAGHIRVANGTNSNGHFILNGGSVALSGDLDSNHNVGATVAASTALIDINGGALTADNLLLNEGPTKTAGGQNIAVMNVNDGTLTFTNNVELSSLGNGITTYTQTGGIVAAGNNIILADQARSQLTASLSGGVLTAGGNFDYGSGTANFTISDFATLDVGGDLLIDGESGSFGITGDKATISVGGTVVQSGNTPSIDLTLSAVGAVAIIDSAGGNASIAGTINVDDSGVTTAASVSTLDAAVWDVASGEWTASNAEWDAANPAEATIGIGDKVAFLETSGGTIDASGASITAADWQLATDNGVGVGTLSLERINSTLDRGAVLAHFVEGSATRNSDLRFAAEDFGEGNTGPDGSGLLMDDGLLVVNGNVRTGGTTDAGNITINGGTLLGTGDLTLGTFSGGQDGTLRVNGGLVSFNGDVREFGDGNNGLIAIDGGTLLSDNIRAQRLRVGDVAGTTGFHAVTDGQNFRSQVDGGGDSFRVGSSGIGVLSMNGGTAGTSAGDSTEVRFGSEATGIGTGIVDGGVIFAHQNFRVGHLGRGVLQVNGGTIDTISFGTANEGNDLIIGSEVNGFGSVNLASGVIVTGDDVTVGRAGTGILVVDGGLMSSNQGIAIAETATGVGTYIQNGGLVISRNANFETAENGNGVAIINGGTLIQQTNNIIIGQNGGSNATFQVNNDARVQVTGSIRVGNSDSATDGGDGYFDMNGGFVTTTGNLDTHGNHLGPNEGSSIATIDISGGTLQVNNILLDNNVPKTTGTLNRTTMIVSGGTIGANNLFEIGSGGNAISSYTQSGGDVTVGNNIIVGASPNSQATAVVNGGNFTAGNNLDIANNGNGDLTISGNANVTATHVNIATGSGTGNLQITGGILNIGGSAGTFDIDNANAFHSLTGGLIQTTDAGGTIVLAANTGLTLSGSTLNMRGGQLTDSDTTTNTIIINGGKVYNASLIDGEITMADSDGEIDITQDAAGNMDGVGGRILGMAGNNVSITDGTFVLDLFSGGGTGSANAFDAANASGLTDVGNLQLSDDISILVNNDNNATISTDFVLGDSWDLLGTFTDGGITTDLSNFILPTLADGLDWDVSNFATDGTIVVVPEPAHMILLFAGSLLAILPRRRAKNSLAN